MELGYREWMDFLLHGNAGSSVMLFYFFKEKKWLLAKSGSQCPHVIFCQLVNLSLFC